jgi:excisionase family DNA binding protein
MAVEEQLTVAELAKKWRCSRGHIYDLIAAKKLRATDIGEGRAKTRIPESAVAEYLDRKMRAAA